MTSYEIDRKRLKHLLDFVSKVSVTIDLWKSGPGIHCMVLTCHFVDSDWKLKKRVLNFVDMLPPIELQTYMIFYINTITMDNATYNTFVVNMLKASLEFHKMLPFDGMIFNVRCYAHILNLLVQCEISDIKDIIDMVRESVKYNNFIYLRRSWSLIVLLDGMLHMQCFLVH